MNNTSALKKFKRDTLKDVIALEIALNQKESENQRLRSSLRESPRIMENMNNTIRNQARIIEIQRYFDPDALLQSQHALKDERKCTAIAIQLLREARINEAITRTKYASLL